jgi:predicted acyl esterase
VRVPLRATCVTIASGERLRLSIATASFPARPVNPGTGERPQDQTIDKARIITLGVITGPGASRLHLCIPPDEEPPP